MPQKWDDSSHLELIKRAYEFPTLSQQQAQAVASTYAPGKGPTARAIIEQIKVLRKGKMRSPQVKKVARLPLRLKTITPIKTEEFSPEPESTKPADATSASKPATPVQSKSKTNKKSVSRAAGNDAGGSTPDLSDEEDAELTEGEANTVDLPTPPSTRSLRNRNTPRKDYTAMLKDASDDEKDSSDAISENDDDSADSDFEMEDIAQATPPTFPMEESGDGTTSGAQKRPRDEEEDEDVLDSVPTKKAVSLNRSAQRSIWKENSALAGSDTHVNNEDRIGAKYAATQDTPLSRHNSQRTPKQTHANGVPLGYSPNAPLPKGSVPEIQRRPAAKERDTRLATKAAAGSAKVKVEDKDDDDDDEDARSLATYATRATSWVTAREELSETEC